MENKIVKISHISDTHVFFDGVLSNVVFPDNNILSNEFYFKYFKFTRSMHLFSQDLFKKVLKYLYKKNIDHVCHTGDVSSFNVEGEFSGTKKMIMRYLVKDKNPCDVMSIVPGNHDMRNYKRFDKCDSLFWKYFGCFCPKDCHPICKRTKQQIFPRVKLVCDSKVMIILFDSTLDSSIADYSSIKDNGEIRDKELELTSIIINKKQEKLEKEPFKIIILHHSPIKRLNSTYVNAVSGLKRNDRKKFMKFCKKYNISLVLNGHFHTLKLKKIDGIYVSDAGTCTRNSLPFIRSGRTGYNIYYIDTDKNRIKKIKRRELNYITKKFSSKYLKI